MNSWFTHKQAETPAEPWLPGLPSVFIITLNESFQTSEEDVQKLTKQTHLPKQKQVGCFCDVFYERDDPFAPACGAPTISTKIVCDVLNAK